MTSQSRRDQTASRAWHDRNWERDFSEIWGRLEDITPALIDELERQGWDRRQVELLAQAGWQYNRKRGVLVQHGEHGFR